MKRLILLTLALSSLPAWAAEISLEGISILGTKRTAYINVDGKENSVVPGDEIAGWVLERIEKRAVYLRSAENGETRELPLHSRLSETPPAAEGAANVEQPGANPPAPGMTPQDNPFLRALQQQHPNPSQGENTEAASSEPPQAFQPRRIADEDVPPGKRKVSTPFGDVLVNDDGRQHPGAEQMQNQEQIQEQEQTQ